MSFGAPQGPCFRFAPLFDLIYPPAVGLFVDFEFVRLFGVFSGCPLSGGSAWLVVSIREGR